MTAWASISDADRRRAPCSHVTDKTTTSSYRRSIHVSTVRHCANILRLDPSKATGTQPLTSAGHRDIEVRATQRGFWGYKPTLNKEFFSEPKLQPSIIQEHVKWSFCCYRPFRRIKVCAYFIQREMYYFYLKISQN